MRGSIHPMTATQSSFGPMPREWRQRRCIRQFDLALRGNSYARHLSFLETGRVRLGHQVLHLAEHLDEPLQDHAVLLAAACFAPVLLATKVRYGGALWTRLYVLATVEAVEASAWALTSGGRAAQPHALRRSDRDRQRQ